jgi:hypothetical protein
MDGATIFVVAHLLMLPERKPMSSSLLAHVLLQVQPYYAPLDHVLCATAVCLSCAKPFLIMFGSSVFGGL